MNNDRDKPSEEINSLNSGVSDDEIYEDLAGSEYLLVIVIAMA